MSNGDYHLKSQAGRWDASGQRWVTDNVTSPCIDTGDPDSPVAFEPYPNGGIINIGTYGGTTEASKSPSGIHAKYGGGTGSSDNPYLIYTALHMNTIGLHEDDFDKHFELMADIDLGGLGEKDFNIIGRSPTRFSGVFDGNGHTISNFSCVSTDIDYAAIFETVEGKDARIANLGMIDPVINVESNELDIPTDQDDPNAGAGYGNTAGALVSYLTFWASLSNCYVRGGSISGDLKVGGLVSYVEFGTVEGCYSTAEVSGKKEIGGLAGHNLWGEITDCHTNSNVTGEDYAGGLVGFNDDSKIENCSATGDVTGGSTVGGFVGHNRGEILSSHSTGQISGIYDVGGLAGRNGGTITNCYSTGSAAGQMYVGGLVGITNNRSMVENCRSTGEVTGVTRVGGLVGRSSGTIKNCYTTGETTGEGYVGGLAGILNDPTTIINCYSAGNVTGITQVGGLVGGGHYMADVFGSFWDIETGGQTTSFAGTGKATAEMQTAGTFLDAGWDFVDETENGANDIWWIIEGQDYPRLWWELAD
ncbi:MAG TPA: hypothetical protein DIU00_17590 [Phycisphaerales bacterium]|nr:hypothetical protein [Phycisphaerales bacterium]